MSKLKTEIRFCGGVPTIHVNGIPVTGLMHWNRNMETVDVCNFAEAGVRIYSFIGNIDLDDGTPANDGCTHFKTMTPSFIDSMPARLNTVKAAGESILPAIIPDSGIVRNTSGTGAQKLPIIIPP